MDARQIKKKTINFVFFSLQKNENRDAKIPCVINRAIYLVLDFVVWIATRNLAKILRNFVI